MAKTVKERLDELKKHRPDWDLAEFTEIEKRWAEQSDLIEQLISELIADHISPAKDADLLQLYVSCVSKLETVSTELQKRGF